jgi:hypothetical protein
MTWRRILLLTLLFLGVLGTTTWQLLQGSDAATVFVQRRLQELFLVPARIAATSIQVLDGRLAADGLHIDDPTRPGTPLCTVGEVRVDVEINPLGDLLAVHGVHLHDVAIDLGPTLPRPETLFRGSSGARDGETVPVPPIELHRGTIRFTPRDGVPPIELREVELRLLPLAEAPSRGELHGSARIVDLDTVVTVFGSLDLLTGAGELQLRLGGIRFGQQALQRLAQCLARSWPEVEVDARVDELTLFASFRPGNGTPELRLDSKLAAVRVRAPGLPKQISDAAIHLQATSRDGGRVSAGLRQSTDAGQLELATEVTGILTAPSYTVSAKGRDLRVDEDALAALSLFPLGAELVRALRPTTGRAEIEIWLRDPERRDGLAEFDLRLQGVAMAYHGFGEGDRQLGFPLPLVDAHGRVVLRDDVVHLEDLRAHIAPEVGGGRVRLDGRVEVKAPRGEDTTLDIRSQDVAFSDHLLQALDALLHDDGVLYRRLSPSGRADVDVHVRPARVLAGGWQVEVRPVAATMRCADFPYRLDDLRGVVTARAGSASFDLTGRHGDGRLNLRGHLPVPDVDGTVQGEFAAHATMENVAIDDDLRRAVGMLDPNLDAAWIASGASGTFDGRVQVWRSDESQPLQHDACLQLRGVDLRLPTAPWRATGLCGQLFVLGARGDCRVEFDALRGRLVHDDGAGAELALLGTLWSRATLDSDLAFAVRQLQLDDRLGATLEQLGALGAGTWALLRPSGTVDLTCRHRSTGGAPADVSLLVQLTDVTSHAPMLPFPAERMSGELEVAGGELRFRDVRAAMAGAPVHCRAGRVALRPPPDGRLEVAFDVSSTGFRVNSDLANLFPGPLQRAVRERQPRGRADVDGLNLRFLVPTDGNRAGFETEIAGQLRAYDVALSLGRGANTFVVEGIDGIVSLDPSRITDAGGALAGSLRGGTFEWMRQPFEAVEANFVADAQQIVLRALRSSLYGGIVQSADPALPAVQYQFADEATPDGRLAAALQFDRVDVRSLLIRSGWANPPYSGSASGRFALERLDGDRIVGAAATGRLVIDPADLGVVPLFTSIYAQLPAAERPRFQRLETSFRLADRRVEFESLKLDSNLLVAEGKGTMHLDGYVDIELGLKNLLGAAADPLMMPLVTWLTNNIVSFHLFGYLRDLRAERRWLTDTTPERTGVGPLPPYCPRPAPPGF